MNLVQQHFVSSQSNDVNFDITANWATGDLNYPVVDQASFIYFLGNRSYEDVNNLTNIIVTNFSLTGNVLKCNLFADGTTLDLSSIEITNFKKVGKLNGLHALFLGANQIITFNPTIALPNSLKYLELGGNQIITFNPTIALPNSLLYLKLNNNKFTNVGYSASEPWANAMIVILNRGTIYFQDNTNTINATNLKSILISKGWTILSN